MKKSSERGLTPLRGDQGARRNARIPSVDVNEDPYSGQYSGPQGNYNSQQGYSENYDAGQQQTYSEPITETDYFQTFEGEEDPLS